MPAPPETGASPLVARLAAGGDGDGFWAEVERRGTPLVEAERGDERLVTFLWRDRHGTGAGTRQVVLIANRLTDPSAWDAAILHRLDGTDVWHRSYWLRSDWRGTYQLAAEDALGGGAGVAELGTRGGAAQRWRGLDAVAVPDPYNSVTFPERRGEIASVTALDGAPPDRWPAAPCDFVEHAVAGRRVWTHGDGDDVLLLLDGDDWAGRLGVGPLLDGLALPITTILVDAGARRDDELAGSPELVSFLADTLLPWADRPGRAFVAGQSLGGLMALTLALERPGVFAGVLAQSASLWWAPPGDPRDGASADTYINERFATMSLPRTRVLLDVGRLEWVLRPQHHALRDTLAAAGHDVTLTEFTGGHEALCWRVALARALPWLVAP